MVEVFIFRHLVTLGQRAGIAAYRVQQFLYGLLDEDTSVIHDDAVVQAFHILNDVRGQEKQFCFPSGHSHADSPRRGGDSRVQTEREIVQLLAFWVCARISPSATWRTVVRTTYARCAVRELLSVCPSGRSALPVAPLSRMNRINFIISGWS